MPDPRPGALSRTAAPKAACGLTVREVHVQRAASLDAHHGPPVIAGMLDAVDWLTEASQRITGCRP